MEKKSTLSDLILLALEKSIDGFVRLEDFTSHLHAYGLGYHRHLNQASLAKALSRLRQGGLVEMISDNEIVLKLTDAGKERAVIYNIAHQKQDWDGKWRLVIFDIPEKRRVVRNVLRRQLINWGFQRLQHSVWASQKNYTQVMRSFIKKVGIEKWVMVIESSNIS